MYYFYRNIDPKVYTNKNENRGKRGVLHLYNMIFCATGCEPLAYKGYGCYCGFLGSGRPTDGIDNTNYAQIPETPYSIQPSHSHSNNRYNDRDQTKVNIHSLKANDNSRNNQLLVGFSHDPYRYSVPEGDYIKGVRNIDPKMYTNKNENRGKRGVLHLYNMIFCATGCEPLAYKGYGCYCGFLGSGRPTDGIDNCCRLHDECYENIYCPFYTVYFQPYYWKCYHNQPLCALENYQTRHNIINGCAARLCECDRKFAMCVKRYSCPRGRALCHSSPLRLLQNLLMFR
ncbi:Phospholipase A2 [Papilio xuthus]|uniref:Phospholipase A2 n=1 Tax=Papilio xuthus TaxID=66420 RepID=A0A0N0P9Q5_PAPXU|nr:Phospholipase A2 [Papilio xuthus]